MQTTLNRYPSDTPIMAKPLTPIAIANLKPSPQRYEVSDGGCRGLRVVVFPIPAQELRRPLPLPGPAAQADAWVRA